MQRLGSAQDRCHGLQGNTSNVVHGLLRRQRHSRSLGVKAKQPTALVLRFETVLHYLIPDLASGAVFCNLFKEVVVGVEEEAEARAEVIHVEAAPLGPFHIFDAVIQSESQLLQRG